jgi:hypothetical protein
VSNLRPRYDRNGSSWGETGEVTKFGSEPLGEWTDLGMPTGTGGKGEWAQAQRERGAKRGCP